MGVEGVLVPPLHKQSRLLTADKLSAVRGCSFCARAVGVLCVFLGLTSGSLVWWESGLQPVWLDRRGWIGGGEPGRVGWGLPFYRVELSLRNLQNRVISACRSQT